MNSTTAELKNRWAHNRSLRAMQQYQAAMMPHLDLMETEKGMMSMVMVSGIAHLVAHGLEPPAALTDIIARESIKSGISEAALEAHARFSSEMLVCYEFDQHLTKNPR